jgi:Na+:H+ antiporter, NhaB family
VVKTVGGALASNFLGNAPAWYKAAILAFLVLNPMLLASLGPSVTGWALIAEFIFTLALALACYPLTAGGLLALQAVMLGLTSPQTVYTEVAHNLPVLLLLMFMVAGIHFMKDLLRLVFTRLFAAVRSKMLLSLLFVMLGAVLSAFLDALTVTAVMITVAYGFYDLFHRYASGKKHDQSHDNRVDREVAETLGKDLHQFRAFLRNILMHGAVGTALGGVMTLVGEPQNLLIGHEMGWNFNTFFFKVAPVSLPVLVVGLLTCLAVERWKLFGYGAVLPLSVRDILEERVREDAGLRTAREKAALTVMALAAVSLVVALALHLAEVGLVGLAIIIFTASFTGVVEENRIAHAFEEAMPFTALLTVFFAVVAVIHDQHLFAPVIQTVLAFSGKAQLMAFYVANGLLSMISDNVFVATVYITETQKALAAGAISREQFELLAVAINTGTNIPSVATPNGQAAFLFLLTSGLAPLLRLSYGRMVVLALPYTVTMSLSGLAAVWLWL